MPFNWSTFKTRTLSALVFIAIMGIGLFINRWLFLSLFLVIHIGCWIEYQSLLIKINPPYSKISFFHKIGIIIAGTAFILWCTNNYYIIDGFNLHALGWWILILTLCILPIIEILCVKKLSFKTISNSILGLVYISLSLGCMLLLYNITLQKQNYTAAWKNNFFSIPTFLIFCIWVNDTMAYIVGSLIGKTPLSFISPKKTWEGTIGGIILCITVMITISYILNWILWVDALVISAIASIIGTLGDLLESKLKRMANVKDSGYMMPGHGGFLDRFDSLLLTIPFVWIYIHFFG